MYDSSQRIGSCRKWSRSRTPAPKIDPEPEQVPGTGGRIQSRPADELSTAAALDGVAGDDREADHDRGEEDQAQRHLSSVRAARAASITCKGPVHITRHAIRRGNLASSLGTRRRARSAGSSSSSRARRRAAAARAAGRRSRRPFSSRSRTPPTSLATTGTPCAIASITAFGRPSVNDGRTATSLPLTSAGSRRAGGRRAASRGRRCRRAEPCSIAARSGPSPTRSARQSSRPTKPGKRVDEHHVALVVDQVGDVDDPQAAVGVRARRPRRRDRDAVRRRRRRGRAAAGSRPPSRRRRRASWR